MASEPASSEPRPYALPIKNYEGLPLTTPGTRPKPGAAPEWLHKPLIPGRSNPWEHGEPRGAIRLFWTGETRMEFDVAYHNARPGFTPGASARFDLATYHPAVPRSSTPLRAEAE